MVYVMPYLSAYSVLRAHSSTQASAMSSAMAPLENVRRYSLKASFLSSGMIVHSPLLMRELPPPSTGAFSRTRTSWPHSSAPMSEAHMPAPP